MEYKINNRDEFISFAKEHILTSFEAQELLDVTRQTLNNLVKRNKITVFKEVNGNKLFLKEDILSRKKEQEELRKKYRPYDD